MRGVPPMSRWLKLYAMGFIFVFEALMVYLVVLPSSSLTIHISGGLGIAAGALGFVSARNTMQRAVKLRGVGQPLSPPLARKRNIAALVGIGLGQVIIDPFLHNLSDIFIFWPVALFGFALGAMWDQPTTPRSAS